MTDSPDEYGAQVSQDDPPIGDVPAEEENAGDHVPTEQVAGTSDETGTVYDATGEPETTPHDEVPNEEDLSGPNAGTSATTEE
jgi:hypothetical protein